MARTEELTRRKIFNNELALPTLIVKESRDDEVSPLPIWNESSEAVVVIFKNIASTLAAYIIQPDEIFEVNEEIAAEFRQRCYDVGSFIIHWEVYHGLTLLKSGKFRCDEDFLPDA